MKHLLLCSLVPGYRRLRRGDKNWAFALQAAFVVLFLVAVPLARTPLGLGFFLGALATLIGVSALRGGGDGEPARLSRAEWAYLLVPQFVVLLCVCVPWLRREVVGLQVYRMGANSMTPTLVVDEMFMVRTGTDVERGGLVVFDAPDRPGTTYVKRVAGLPGDEVHGLRVPAGHVFVIGDNAGNSRDSRHFGPIPFESITGRPLYVVWADAWQRIGTPLAK